MSREVPVVVVADRSGAVVAQNVPAQRLMGVGTGKGCWEVIGGLENAEGLPCRRDCVAALLTSGMESSQHERPKIAGQRHHLTCVPVDDVVVCTLSHGTEERPDQWQFLTTREREVLQMLAEGETTSSAATLLGVSESTLRTHVEKMRIKLGVKTRAALVALGFRLGYLG